MPHQFYTLKFGAGILKEFPSALAWSREQPGDTEAWGLFATSLNHSVMSHSL